MKLIAYFCAGLMLFASYNIARSKAELVELRETTKPVSERNVTK